jgi:predicted  nucleic acid-binding Zn-ribbon protein
MNRMGMVTQQAGYQVGDFLVQVQSGTNAFVAFGQQATQLVGLMGMFNPALIGVGAALGIAIPLVTALGAAFMRTRQGGKSFVDQLKEVESALGSAREAFDLTQQSIGELRDVYGVVNEELRTFLELQTQARQLQAIQETLRVFQSLRDEMTGMFSTEVTSLQRTFNINLGQANALAREFKDVTEETTLEGQIREIVQLRDLILQTTGGVEDMTEEQRAFYLSVVDAEDMLRRAAGQTKEIADNLSDASFNFRAMGGLNPRDPSQIPGEGAAAAVQQQRIEELRAQWEAYQDSLKDNETNARRSVVKPNEEIADSIKQINDLSESMANSFGDAFMSIVDGTKSTKDAFKAMARSIIAELYQIFVVKQITGFITGALQNAFTGGLAPATSPVPTPRPSLVASGGMINPNQPYLVGERGPELVMPNRQSTVMNADLTKKALGGGNGETIVVNQTINVSTGVQQTVRNEIQSLMPQISEAAKSAVVDAKRRGGSYGRAFG